jgi:hypothetical protein
MRGAETFGVGAYRLMWDAEIMYRDSCFKKYATSVKMVSVFCCYVVASLFTSSVSISELLLHMLQ